MLSKGKQESLGIRQDNCNKCFRSPHKSASKGNKSAARLASRRLRRYAKWLIAEAKNLLGAD